MSQSNIEAVLHAGFTERGNSFFVGEESGSLALFKPINGNMFIVVEYIPMNYPSINVTTLTFQNEQAFADNAHEHYLGWRMLKSHPGSLVKVDSDGYVDPDEEDMSA